MCNYCKNVDTGNDFDPIISKNISYGVLGNVASEVYIQGERNGKVSLVMGLCPDTAADFVEVKKTIKYCPMCGRKF